jgi:hypothetical protein
LIADEGNVRLLIVRFWQEWIAGPLQFCGFLMYFEQLVLTNVPAPWSAGADGAPRRNSYVANRVAQ